jgi:cytochrome c5
MSARELAIALILLAAAAAAAAQERGATLIQTRCLVCHGDDLIRQQRLTRDGWTREVDKMIGWGAVVTPEERPVLIEALLAIRAGTPQRQDAAGALLLATRCQLCHDLQLIDQQRLDEAGWTREVDKMIAWGAAVRTAEKEALVVLLVQRRSLVLPYAP